MKFINIKDDSPKENKDYFVKVHPGTDDEYLDVFYWGGEYFSKRGIYFDLPMAFLDEQDGWVLVAEKMTKPVCINGISPNLCDSIRKKEKMKPCQCLQYEEYLKTELNQDKGEVIAFHPSWIDPDFNPDGIRIGFINGEGKFWSAEWNDYQDTYQNNQEVMPTHYMRKPQPPATKD